MVHPHCGQRWRRESRDLACCGGTWQHLPSVGGETQLLWANARIVFAALALARASDLFAAGIDFHGVHDWNVVIGNFVQGYDPQKTAASRARGVRVFTHGLRQAMAIARAADPR
jgi:hypothetical protein